LGLRVCREIDRGGMSEEKSLNIEVNGIKRRHVLVRIIFAIVWSAPLVIYYHCVPYVPLHIPDEESQGFFTDQQLEWEHMLRYYIPYVIWLGLSFFGLLPGTGGFKRSGKNINIEQRDQQNG
jgi:hypothetical protein